MRVFENKEFRRDSFADRDSAAIYEGFDFRRCYFESYFLSLTDDPALRSVVRGVRITDCSQRGCTLYAAIFEDVLVDGFKTNGQLVRTHGAVFNHVVLRGRIDRMMLSNDMLPSSLENDADRRRGIALFREANADYYRKVDWALDISDGEFKELELRDIPGHLIRRDAETQFLFQRERVLQHDWRELDFRAPAIPFTLDLMLKSDTPNKVLIAPKGHPKFRDYLDDLRLLRKAGIADPD